MREAIRQRLASIPGVQSATLAVTPPLTYGVVLLTMLVVGALACLLPARRASRIDPLLVIRE